MSHRLVDEAMADRPQRIGRFDRGRVVAVGSAPLGGGLVPPGLYPSDGVMLVYDGGVLSADRRRR